MTDLEKLIERLEAATEGSRHLDSIIHWQRFDGIGTGYRQDAPAYTSSIDVAMTLFKSRDGYGALHMFWFEGSKGATVKAFPFDEADEADMIRVTARTLPLAICIAALKARARHPSG